MIKLLMDITISSSIVAIIIIVVRFLLKDKISSKWKYYLWFIFLARLIILPFPESNISVFNILNNNQIIEGSTYEYFNNKSLISELDNSKDLGTIKNINNLNKDESINNEKNFVNTSRYVNKDKFESIISIIYVIGVVSCIGYYLVTYKIFINKMKNNNNHVDRLYIDKLDEIKERLSINKDINIAYGESSFIYGIKNINLVVVPNLDEIELKSILIHELIHYKYKDLYINWIMILFKSVYWFNPVVYFVFKQMKKDCEMACDERVIESRFINKVDYSKSLLKNALNNNKYLIGTTSFSKNNSDIKGRIENMKNLKNKKNMTVLITSFILLIIGAICLTNPSSAKSDKENPSNYNNKEVFNSYSSQSDTHKDLIKKLKNTNKIEVYHDYHANNIDKIEPVEVKDINIINNYLNLLSKNVKQSNEEMRGSSVNNQKLIFYTDKESIEISYSYDDLYNFGFISYKGEDIYLDYDFFRLISNTERYSPEKSNISKDVEKLFEKYNWTPSFLIAKHKVKISEDLIYAPEKGIDELYWAYNLQLSKSINLDFSDLLGKEVYAEVYYLLEPLPDFTYPIIDTRAVVLKHNGSIVGAYIDSGILNRAICSLDRKSFDEITGYTLEDYLIQNHIDENSELNKEVSNLSTRELIELYYKSQSDKDVAKYLATLDMGAVLSLLESNGYTLKSELFNKFDKNHEIFNNANKTEVLEIKENDESSGIKEVNIRINILKSNQVTIDKGIYDMIATMRKNDNNTYKINSIGF